MGRALIVVSYGSSGLLAENLGGWDRASAPGWTVVVVDNATTDAERSRARALAADRGWLLVEPETNLGFGDGCAAGVAAVPDDAPSAILLLNPDACITVEDADALADRVDALPGTLLVPQMFHGDGRPAFARAFVDRRTGLPTGPDAPDGVEWLTGACLAMSRTAWDRLDGFPSDYFLYWEDVDLAWRWHAMGGRVAVASDLRCVHDAGGTQGSGSARTKSALYYYYNCRNRLVFARLNTSGRDRLRWALIAPRYAAHVVLRGGRRQLLRPWTCVLPALRGTLSGLLALVRRRPALTPTSRDTAGG